MAGKGNKKGYKQEQNRKKSSKKNSGLILTAAAAVILCLAVVIISNIKSSTEEDNVSAAVPEAERQSGEVTVLSEGESLVIPTADVTTQASFYTVEVDGATMEIIAVRDSEGSIRTAFNTCQICYSSGRGYYVQRGDFLICQNCGNKFTVNQVEIESGGCNPWPIFEDDKTVTEDTIEISYEFLAASKKIFANWKAG